MNYYMDHKNFTVKKDYIYETCLAVISVLVVVLLVLFFIRIFDATAIGKPYVLTAGGSIGASVTSGTEGSVLFVGSGGVLQQNNNNFFWDNSANRFGIGTTTPGSILSIQGVANFVANASSTFYNALGIGTTSASSQLAVATTTATTTVTIGSAIGGFGSCLQLYSASGTPYRLYIDGETEQQSTGLDPLRVEKGGCGDATPRP